MFSCVPGQLLHVKPLIYLTALLQQELTPMCTQSIRYTEYTYTEYVF
jgi:hypothetical protein